MAQSTYKEHNYTKMKKKKIQNLIIYGNRLVFRVLTETALQTHVYELCQTPLNLSHSPFGRKCTAMNVF